MNQLRDRDDLFLLTRRFFKSVLASFVIVDRNYEIWKLSIIIV